MKQWLKENIFVKDMFIYIVISAVIFYSPSWVSLIFGITTGNNVLLGFSASYVLIWAGPFTPTIPAILGLAVILKQLFKLKKKGDQEE